MPGSSAPGNPLTGDVDPGARRDASGTGTTHRGHNGSTPGALRGKHRENTGSTASSIAVSGPSQPSLRSLYSRSPVSLPRVSSPSPPGLRSLSPGSRDGDGTITRHHAAGPAGGVARGVAVAGGGAAF
ncbi:unnamed protein product [Boreogadus saida]